MPVVEDEHVLGIIGRRRLQRLGRRRFGSTRASEVMTVPPQAPFLAPDDPLWEALDPMNSGGIDGLPSRSRAGWPGCSPATACPRRVRHAGRPPMAGAARGAGA